MISRNTEENEITTKVKDSTTQADKTYYLIKKANDYGFKPVIDPVLNIVALEDENPAETCLKLRKIGWYVSICKCVGALRIIVMPHIEKEHIDEFLGALGSVKGD